MRELESDSDSDRESRFAESLHIAYILLCDLLRVEAARPGQALAGQMPQLTRSFVTFWPRDSLVRKFAMIDRALKCCSSPCRIPVALPILI